jgi:hypothetical protein
VAEADGGSGVRLFVSVSVARLGEIRNVLYVRVCVSVSVVLSDFVTCCVTVMVYESVPVTCPGEKVPLVSETVSLFFVGVLAGEIDVVVSKLVEMELDSEPVIVKVAVCVVLGVLDLDTENVTVIVSVLVRVIDSVEVALSSIDFVELNVCWDGDELTLDERRRVSDTVKEAVSVTVDESDAETVPECVGEDVEVGSRVKVSVGEEVRVRLGERVSVG